MILKQANKFVEFREKNNLVIIGYVLIWEKCIYRNSKTVDEKRYHYGYEMI